MRYQDALKEWNDKKNNGMYCSPLKGSKEHAEVVAIQNKAKNAAKVASNVLKGAIKRKMTKQFEPAPSALAIAKPKKKPDDNLLHNLPEDIQRRIMKMAKVKDEWTKGVMTFEDYYNTFYNLDGVKDFKKEYFDILDGNLDKSKVKALKDIPPNTTIPYEWTDLKRAKAPQAIKILKRENNKLIKLTEQKTKEDKKAFLEKALVFVFKYTNSPNTYHTYSEGEIFNGIHYKNLKALTYDYDNTIKGTRTIPMPWMNKLDQM